MGDTFESLTFDEIAEINRQQIARFGGNFDVPQNLNNPDPLNYILAAIQGSLFGYDQFPTTVDKAAAIGYRIITRHVFADGNKRTGMMVTHVLLLKNGLRYRKDPMVLQQDMIDVALRVASNQITEDDFTKWVKDRVV